MSAQKIYPGKGRIGLDGGKNNKFDRALILDNESPDCQNVRFVNGSVETREGTTKLNTAAVGSFVCDGLYTRNDNSGSETMVAWFGGTLWDLQGTSFITIGSAQSIYTAGERVAAAQNENHIFFGNGGTLPYKYNGTDFTRHGVYAPLTQPVAATAATGAALTGDYQYKVTYVNSQVVEGDVSVVTPTFTAAGENIALTSIPVAPQSWGVASRRLYRTEAGGTAFKRVIELGDNTTTTYEDAILDGALGVVAPTDNGVPPLYDTIVYHQSRLFCNDTANPNYLRYSDLADPYDFTSTNFFRVGDNTSDLLRSVKVHADSIVCYCDNTTWLIYMPSTDDTTWLQIRIKSPYGSQSPHGAFDYQNKQMFPAVQNDKFVGFAALTGVEVEPQATLLTVSTQGSDLKSDAIETDMFTVVEANIKDISSIVYKNRAYCSVTYGAGATENNRIYVFDFSISNLSKKQKFSWTPDTGINAAQFAIYSGNLYFADSTATGFVHKYEDGTYTDNGAAIDSYFWTKEYGGAGADVNFHKDFRRVNLLYEKSGDWEMSMFHRVDSDKGGGNVQNINLDPGGSLWGTMVWGTDVWGGGSDEEEGRLFLMGARGKRIQFKFTNQNTAGQKFKVLGLNFTYNVRGNR